MAYFVGLLLFFYSFIGFCVKRKFLSPIVLFNLMWGCISILSGIRLFGLYETSETVYILVLLAGTFFSIGAILARPVRSLKERTYTTNNFFLYPMFIFSFVILSIMFMAALRLIMSGVSFGTIRYLYIDQIQSTYFLAVGYKFFAYPVTVALATHFIANFYINKKIDPKLFTMSILLSVMDFVAVADRMILIYFILGAIFIYREVSSRMTRKQKRKVRNIILVGIACFWGVLISRGLKGTEVLSSVYLYFVGPMPYFSERIKDISNLPPTIIASTLQGFLRPLMGIVEVFGIKWELFERASDFLLNNQQIVINITNTGGTFNYFSTAFAFFYRDGGTLGVCIFSTIFGWLSQACYYRYRVSKDCLSISCYIFVFVSIVMSFMNISLAETGMAWGLIFSRIILKKDKQR